MTDTSTSSPAAKPRIPAFVLDYAALVIVLAALIVGFSLTATNFLSRSQFSAMVNPNLPMVLMTVSMTYVLIIAGIDLSVGSVMALSACVMGVLYDIHHWPVGPSIAAGLLTGIACGMFNGLVTVRWKLPSFIVTLGMLLIARGIAHLITGSHKQNMLGSGIEELCARCSRGSRPPC